MKNFDQYDIVLVNLDPTIGSEINKTHPCLIISPNELNKYLQTVIVAPITSSSKSYPTRVDLKNNKTNGWIVIDQVRTIDKVRIVKFFEQLHHDEVIIVKEILMKTFVD